MWRFRIRKSGADAFYDGTLLSGVKSIVIEAYPSKKPTVIVQIDNANIEVDKLDDEQVGVINVKK